MCVFFSSVAAIDGAFCVNKFCFVIARDTDDNLVIIICIVVCVNEPDLLGQARNQNESHPSTSPQNNKQASKQTFKQANKTKIHRQHAVMLEMCPIEEVGQKNDTPDLAALQD